MMKKKIVSAISAAAMVAVLTIAVSAADIKADTVQDNTLKRSTSSSDDSAAEKETGARKNSSEKKDSKKSEEKNVDAHKQEGASEQKDSKKTENPSADAGKEAASKSKNDAKGAGTSTTGDSNKNSSSNSSQSNNNQTQAHTHSWATKYRTVHHDAVYEQRWVQDSAAWDEYVPTYTTVERSICNGCGADITGNESAHNKNHALAGEKGGWRSEWSQVQTGTQTIHHDATGHYENVVVQNAYDEQVASGSYCTGCGATK